MKNIDFKSILIVVLLFIGSYMMNGQITKADLVQLIPEDETDNVYVFYNTEDFVLSSKYNENNFREIDGVVEYLIKDKFKGFVEEFNLGVSGVTFLDNGIQIVEGTYKNKLSTGYIPYNRIKRLKIYLGCILILL